MAEELGKIHRPEAAAFKGKRKLYVVPLIYRWPEAEKEYTTLFDRYWDDVLKQLNHMADRIGAVKHLYHEGVDESGEQVLTTLEKLNPPSRRIADSLIESGAQMVCLEDRELIAESLDWERFIMFGFASTKVAKIATEHFRNAIKSRYDHILKIIDDTLKPDEAGVLFIREGYPIQFPQEIEVFSIFPPSLDEIHRYLRNRPAETDEPEEDGESEAGESTPEPSLDAEGTEDKS